MWCIERTLSNTKWASASTVITAHAAPLTVGLSFPFVLRTESKLQTRPVCVHIRCASSISYSSQASQWPATEPGTIIVSQSWLTSCDATCQTLPPLSVLCCCRRRLHCFSFSLCVWVRGGGVWRSVFSSEQESLFPAMGETPFAVTKSFVSLVSIIL